MTTPFIQEKNKKFIVIGDIDASEIGMKTINRLTSLVDFFCPEILIGFLGAK